MKYIIIFITYFSLVYFSFQITAYFKFEFCCVNDSIDRIKYSGGEIKPINSHSIIQDSNYTFYFPELMHNLNESLCIYLLNSENSSSFTFKKASLNEYDISEIDYDYFWECSNCNLNYNHNKKCYNRPKIEFSNHLNSYIRNNELCLLPTDDISIFNIGEKYINNNYYIGKTINFILSDEKGKIKIDNIFNINGRQNYLFDLDAVSLKLVNISNIFGSLFNNDEELFQNSIFNAKNKYLVYKNNNDGGYLMTITIETRTRIKNSISYLTSQTPAILNVFISKKNCTMTDFSNNFCQECKNDYGKYGDKCYHRNEKFRNLYYNELSQTFEKCEISNDIFYCSVCPKGTFIKEKIISSQICEKCPTHIPMKKINIIAKNVLRDMILLLEQKNVIIYVIKAFLLMEKDV